MEMDVASMMTVIPRISTPTLTPQEMADLDPADLAAMSIEDPAQRQSDLECASQLFVY